MDQVIGIGAHTCENINNFHYKGSLLFGMAAVSLRSWKFECKHEGDSKGESNWNESTQLYYYNLL